MQDQRLKVFCSELAPEIFHPIEHIHDVYRPDPLDVPEIHQSSRVLFERLVEQATGSRAATSGRILLLKGEAGAGKTHLMRAFRNYVHEQRRAFFGYMQMTTSARHYDRYVLQKLIDSLDQAYLPPEQNASSLKILSDALIPTLPRHRVDALREAYDTNEAAGIIDELADRLIDRLYLQKVDSDIVRVLLYLQVDRPSVKNRAIKYLRGEALSNHDCAVLGNMAPRNVDDDPLHIVSQLAAISREELGRGLVICVDQLEDMVNLDDARERYAKVMDAVKQVAEIPGTLVVISCLEAFYNDLRKHLPISVIDRIENDPRPQTLTAQRTVDEIRQLVVCRLRYLYATAGVLFDERDPTYPIPDSVLGNLSRATTRHVLADCQRYRERTRALGHPPAQWPETEADTNTSDIRDTGGTQVVPLVDLAPLWNDYTNEAQVVPDEESELAALLCESLSACGRELGAPEAFQAQVMEKDNWCIRVRHGAAVQGVQRDLVIGVCERASRGGGLLKQIKELSKKATGARAVIARSTEFPSNPVTETAQAIGHLVAQGGRRTVIENVAWRRMVALQAFCEQHRTDEASLAAFLRQERPLTQLQAFREMLALDDLQILEDKPSAAAAHGEPAAAQPPSTNKPANKPANELSNAGATNEAGAEPQQPQSGQAILVGHTLSRRSQPVTLEPDKLTRHVAFLGGTGSGKTTAALMLIETLLLRGIPAILVDRKGDLCGYADADAWNTDLGDTELDRLRNQLRDRVEVALYTPGNPNGRSLAIPLLPRGVKEMNPFDREQVARVAAWALGDMMNLTKTNKAQGQRTVMQVALQQLAELEESSEITIQSLISYLQDRDPGLLAALGGLSKFVDTVALDLEVLVKGKGSLMGTGSEPLDTGELLGRAHGQSHPDGKTRLSIISTKFLGSDTDIQFWVAQLLLDIQRWFSQHSARQLQAVLMLDEADIYLPATKQPATKQPVEDLLRRARSMGLAVFLATQTPGDLDYRCRENILTWFTGRLKEPRALSKLKELFEEANADLGALAGQELGEFQMITEGKTARLKTVRNAVSLPSQLSSQRILECAARGSKRT